MPTKTQDENSRYCKGWYERIKKDPAKWQAFLNRRSKYKKAKTAKTARRSSYIYLIEAVGLGVIKVGVSVNPEFRLRCLQTGCPAKLRMRVTYPCDLRQASNIERELHRKLEQHRAYGEWFRAEAPLIQEMLRVEPELAKVTPKC